ncbi:hypothetical protein V2J09_015967 [Rumex salicifolius]
MAASLGLETKEVPMFGVTIGNGAIISCDRICPDVAIQLPGVILRQDFFAFDMGTAELVLGVRWLASLDMVEANWKELFLTFRQQGRENSGADALSRRPHSAELLTLVVPFALDFHQWKNALLQDPFTAEILKNQNNNVSDDLIEQVKNLAAETNPDDVNTPAVENESNFVPNMQADYFFEGDDVNTPAVENESNFVPNMQADYFFEGDDGVGNFEVDYLIDEVPFLEGHIGDLGNQEPLPDFPMEDNLSFYLMNTENSMIKQANMMETMLPLPSSSGSSKRKNVGGDGDTASSGLQGHKKTQRGALGTSIPGTAHFKGF